MALTATEFELASALLTCLEEALEEHPAPPVHRCVRVGEDVRQDVSLTQDECCEGLAYVKVNSIVPSTNFPNPDETAMYCSPEAWAVDLEMGIFRCEPQGSLIETATCEEWTAVTQAVALDAAAMRRAVVCFRGTLDPGDFALVRQWLPIGPQGGCTGGAMVVTVSFIC